MIMAPYTHASAGERAASRMVSRVYECHVVVRSYSTTRASTCSTGAGSMASNFKLWYLVPGRASALQGQRGVPGKLNKAITSNVSKSPHCGKEGTSGGG